MWYNQTLSLESSTKQLKQVDCTSLDNERIDSIKYILY